MSLSLDALDGASRVVKGLEAVKKSKVVKAIDNVHKLIPEADNMCKLGCKSSMCAADANSEVTLTYNIPSGCQCRYMEVKNLDGLSPSIFSLMPGVLSTSAASTITITPTKCAMNAAMVNSQTGQVDSRVEFSYMGCYVGRTDDSSTYNTCKVAYKSLVVGNAIFARCQDQFVHTFNLDTQSPSTELMYSPNSTSGYPSAGDTTSSKPSSSTKHLGALVCLTTVTTVITLVGSMLV